MNSHRSEECVALTVRSNCKAANAWAVGEEYTLSGCFCAVRVDVMNDARSIYPPERIAFGVEMPYAHEIDELLNLHNPKSAWSSGAVDCRASVYQGKAG